MRVADIGKTLLTLGAALIALVSLWHVLAMILAVDRGLDLTDEGYYLLAADPQSTGGAQGVPFGWHTAPLLWAASYDIGAFRAHGAFLLVLSGAWFGYWASRAAWKGIIDEGTAFPVERRAFVAVFVLLAAVGALMFYAGLVRTPSYNWLGLFGIYIGAGGVLGLWGCSNDPDHRRARVVSFLLGATTVFGLFLTLPAKPSIAPMLFCAAALLFLLSRRSLRPLFWVGLGLSLAPFAAAAVGLWPENWMQVLMDTFLSERPALRPEHGPLGAALSLLYAPSEFLADISNFGWLLLVCIGVGLLAIALSSIVARHSCLPALAGILLLAGCALFISKAVNPWIVDSEPVNRWIFPAATTSNLVLLAGCLAAALATSLRSGGAALGRMINLLLLVGFIAVLPIIFAFGSGHGAYTQTFLAAGVLPVAGLLALSAVPQRSFRLPATLLVFTFSLLCVAGTLADSWRSPYRIPPITANTESVEIGPHGAKLLLSPKLAEFFREMHNEIGAQGWVAGTPLLAMLWTWSTTVPYALGATVPDGLMLTIFGYPNSAKLAKFNLERTVRHPPFDRTWIMVGDLRRLMPGKREDWKGPIGTEDVFQSGEMLEVLDAFQDATGKSLDDDYQVFETSGGVKAWRPNVITTN